MGYVSNSYGDCHASESIVGVLKLYCIALAFFINCTSLFNLCSNHGRNPGIPMT